jgi:hypothetical protein
MITIAEWIALAGVAVVLAGLIIGGVWKVGLDMGDVKSGVNELLGRDERTNRRVDTIEFRLNDHTERIARIEGNKPPCEAHARWLDELFTRLDK